MGAKNTGTFTEAYYYVEEELYMDEADTILDFCKWIDNEIGGAGAKNIDVLFEAFINPKNKDAVKFSLDIKKIIGEFKSRLKKL